MSSSTGKKYWIFAAAAIGALALDQITKALITAFISPGAAVRLIPGLELTHQTNTGAAFGLFAGRGQIIFWVSLLVVVLTLLWFFRSRGMEGLWYYVALGLIVGGAAGNLTDRIFRGAVVDYIDVGWWPVFNAADIAIVAGVLVMLALIIWNYRGKISPDGGGGD
jgi:signal peptidase II